MIPKIMSLTSVVQEAVTPRTETRTEGKGVRREGIRRRPAILCPAFLARPYAPSSVYEDPLSITTEEEDQR